LDLRGIDHRHEPDAQFRAALQRRLAAIVAGADPGSVTEARDLAMSDLSDEQLVPVKEIYVPSTDSPTSETKNRRRLAMAAAAVVAVIGVAAIAINIGNSEDEAPAPAAATTVASTTAAPTTIASTTVVPTTIAARTGTYTLSGVRITFAVPAGWADYDWTVAKPNTIPVFGVGFNEVANIYNDSCPSVLVDPPVGPTVDDLASAWVDLPGFHATPASDITVDGFHGKQLEFTVPDYNTQDCAYGDFKLLNSVGGGDYWAQGPNQHHKLWIVDVNGTRLVIVATYFPDTSAEDRAALDEVLASIQIG
jgi:hypothetical protein